MEIVVSNKDVDWVNHPPHYQTLPLGFYAECIEYTRHMMFSQGNCFKYVYRAGSKDDLKQDVNKALWYLKDAIEHDGVLDLSEEGLPSIDPNATYRSRVCWMLVEGQAMDALALLEEKWLVLEERVPHADHMSGEFLVRQ